MHRLMLNAAVVTGKNNEDNLKARKWIAFLDVHERL